MIRKHPPAPSSPGRLVKQWFCMIFAVIMFVFLLVLLPLLGYSKSIFTDLELEKSRQQLHSGIVRLETAVSGILSTVEATQTDTQFLALRYHDPDYASIPVTDQMRMQKTISDLTASIPLVSDFALQMNEDVVITPSRLFFHANTRYYPDFFQVDNLSASQWNTMLEDHSGGFFDTTHQIKTPNEEYCAVVFAVQWARAAHFYACFNIDDIRAACIADSDLSGYYLTISRADGETLYSDLPEESRDSHSVSQVMEWGNLTITIHLSDSLVSDKMQPLYIFLTVYCVIFGLFLLALALFGVRFSSKPILEIIRVLERSGGFRSTEEDQPNPSTASLPLYGGFLYIRDSISNAEKNITRYQDTILSQQQALRTRYWERALNGQLTTAKEKEQFYTYFPDFPDHYCLFLLQLDLVEDEPRYAAPLTLLHTFLEEKLHCAYQQQMNDSELLIAVDARTLEPAHALLDFLVANINQEEPAYQMRCLESSVFSMLEGLPAAYRQLQDMDALVFPDSHLQVCVANKVSDAAVQTLPMAELLTLYTAISYGNRDMALQALHKCDDLMRGGSRQTFELVRVLLRCIKREHPTQLSDAVIPLYRANTGLYQLLEGTVTDFCQKVRDTDKDAGNPLADQLIAYVDAHYTEYGLCADTLEGVFNRSSSTIRKVFKSATGMTVSEYIEQKRMTRANVLLASKEKAIAEIAMECGFSNANSFYKAYRRKYGHAPTTKDVSTGPES